jgi:arylsulfatase A-like enzyme
VRKGDWKLIRFWADNDDQTDRHELYNLREDQQEKKDRAAGEPGKVKELGKLLDGFLADTKAVIPKANPAYKKSAAHESELPNPDDVA